MATRRRVRTLGAILIVVTAEPQGLVGQTRTALRAKAPDTTRVLDRRGGLEVTDVPLARALSRLSETAALVIAFSPSLVKATQQRVTCDCENLSVAETLDRLLAATEFTYSVVRGQVVITLNYEPTIPAHHDPRVENARIAQPAHLRAPDASASMSALANVLFTGVMRSEPADRSVSRQPGAVAGIVADERGVPIAAASVTAEGQNVRAIADVRGRFRLEGLAGTEVRLRVLMVGYRALSQAVRVGDLNLRLVMTPVAVNLEELVTTGTPGEIQRRAIGHAVSRVRATEVVETAPVHNIGDLLNGRAAGVVVTPGTGVVGAGPRIQIRGRTSISLRSEPLIYIDGIRVTNEVSTGPSTTNSVISRLSDLNPDEIESIEIIKGPAAATLYGTEASNGVMQIITKRGKVGDRPSATLTTRQGGNWLMDAAGRMGPNFYIDQATGQVRTQDLFAQEKAAGRPIFRTGHAQGYDLNLIGGRDLVRYFAGAGYDREEGIEPVNDFGRMSGRLNLNLVPTNSLDIAANVGVVQAKRHLSQEVGQSVIGSILYSRPQDANTPTRGFRNQPPEAAWSAFQSVQNVQRYTVGLQLNHRPSSWFSQRLTAGVDQTAENNEFLIPLQPDSIRRFLTPTDAQGRKSVTRRNLTVNTLDYAATVTVPVGRALRSSTSIGGQFYRNFVQIQTSTGTGFPAPGVTTVGSAATTSGSDDFIENTTLGAYVQQQFALNDRLFLTGAIRTDDNSAFGQEFNIVTYPKASAAWVVTDEPFWKMGFVETLKLRAAYGQSGQQPRAFAALQTFRPTSGSAGSTVTPQAYGNPTLEPERGEEIELGFEAGLFGGRVGIDFTYYRKHTKNAILLRDVAPSTGFPGQQFVNAGLITNKGVELLLNAGVVKSQQVAWDLSLSLSTNANKIVDLDPANPALTFFSLPHERHQEGHPISSFFDKRIVSATYNPTTKLAENILCDGGPGAAPLPCDQAPRVFVGRSTPEYEGGVTNNVTLFNRLRFRALVDFKGGYRKFDNDTWVRCTITRVCESNVRPEKFDPIVVAYNQLGSGNIVVAHFEEDATFAKLRELSLSYDLPNRVARSIGAVRGVITLAGRNLHTWTRYRGLDPESLVQFLIDAPGTDFYLDQANTPQLASFMASITLTW